MIESVRPAPSRVEPTSDRPVVPVYGIGTLGAVLPGAAAALGVPTGLPALPFPEVRSVCVVIVDGLGADLLDAAGPGGPDSADRCEAPFLTGLTSVPPGRLPGHAPRRMSDHHRHLDGLLRHRATTRPPRHGRVPDS